MTGTFLDGLDDVVRDPILVDGTPGGLVREARSNLWMFSVTQQQTREMAPSQVQRFLHAIVYARSEQLVARYSEGHPMCWFDEQAAHLCFSLISVQHRTLPFASTVIIVEDLDAIIARFLGFPYHDGIPLNACMVMDTGDDTDTEAEPVDISFEPLQVWTRWLPMRAESLASQGNFYEAT